MNKIKHVLIVSALISGSIFVGKEAFVGSDTKQNEDYFNDTFTIEEEIDTDTMYPYNDANYDDEEQYFGDYPCTDDCSGHVAGYEWAREKGIADPDDCGGNSQSFIEGCMQYAEENL